MTGHPTIDTNLNLGPYSIRTPEKSTDYRVGSFWRRQQHSAKTPESSDCELIYSIPKRQKLATATNVISTEKNRHQRGSTTSRATSCDTDSALDPSQLIIDEAQVIYTDSMNNNLPSPIYGSENHGFTSRCFEGLDKSFSREPLSLMKSPALVIDTQSSGQQTKNDDDTHESVAIELNPASLQSYDDDTTITSIRPSEGLNSYSLRTPDEPRVQMRLKTYPKRLPYHRILAGVVFVMSGFENPRRAKLRDTAVAMGAKYQAKWNRFCTHLICKFKHTAKFEEVSAKNGRIVREHWIQRCSKQRELLDWRNYKLGKYPYPDSEEEVDLD